MIAEVMNAKINLRWPLAPLALLGTGLCLILYVSSQYGLMWISQHRLFQELQRQAAQSIASDGPHLTRLVIPRIDLDAVVVEGTTQDALRAGPGHMKDSPSPGDEGNSVIAGHRDTFFRRLGELRIGDSIRIERSGHQYNYNIVSRTVVAADDTGPLASDRNRRLTLITCYPFHVVGPAPKRFVIEARPTS